MLIVYVLTYNFADEFQLIGIFKTREAAERAYDNQPFPSQCEIEEYEVKE